MIKDNNLHIRVSKKDKKEIVELAKNANKTLSFFILDKILYTKSYSKEQEDYYTKMINEIEKCRLEINYIGKNINQISKKLNSGIYEDEYSKLLEDYLFEIEKIRKKLNEL